MTKVEQILASLTDENVFDLIILESIFKQA